MAGNEDLELRLANTVEASNGSEAIEVRRTPEPPQGLSEAEAAALRQLAAQLARKLETASGSEELEAVDSVANLGIQAQPPSSICYALASATW